MMDIRFESYGTLLQESRRSVVRAGSDRGHMAREITTASVPVAISRRTATRT